ncbi:rhoGEF domain-containing protein gxcJ [Chrysoperla carnea]|uniref:rhoGEF domain-containing protein gxcJ n=1 Tax=Chrysoperla carnea TaxID=189513 RepID=UPI001D069FD8|nr:rhoGEF domain-containing protein gxcJ [Chrysoperla carnea]
MRLFKMNYASALILVLIVLMETVSLTLGVAARLPRTSAAAAAAAANNNGGSASNGSSSAPTLSSRMNSRTNNNNHSNNVFNGTISSTASSINTIVPPYGTRNTARNREQYLFNVFEVIVSTLESKLQRIDNLDKAVEHLMRRVESMDSRVNDNIDKTESVIVKLRRLDNKLFNSSPIIQNNPAANIVAGASTDQQHSGTTSYTIHDDNSNSIDMRLVSLDQKVSDIDSKLSGLKIQLDNNFLPPDSSDSFNAEPSEKKPISMNILDIAKSLNNDVIKHVTAEIDQLRTATTSVDRKLQFHINIVSENLGKVLNMMTDVHNAIVEDDQPGPFYLRNQTTTTAAPITTPKSVSSKLDSLVQKMTPIINVSEKMDEVWDVVVGTKSSVDDLVPKSDELLTQTQRQERAIGEIHDVLRTKTNKIIENLGMVEKRLKKQEDDVATLAQRPVPAELLLDPTIDRLVEYDPSRYATGLVEDITSNVQPDTTLPIHSNNIQQSFTTIPPITSTSSTASTVGTTITTVSSLNQQKAAVTQSQQQQTEQQGGSSSTRGSEKRKGGIIFPSVKNKPSPANTTFTTDVAVNFKDVKGYSCIDLLNAGMRQSGVYYLQIRGTTYWFLKVYCEQEIAEGGWTVIQRRDDFGEPRENFNRDWADYKNGFGDPAKEFWLGNENIYMLTNNEDYILRVELEDFEGNKRYAQYSHFKIYSEGEYYKLEIDGYEGNAGDSLNDPWYGSNNSPFSTYNRDNDRSSLNCASMLKGGWWWKSCGRGLNGLYLNDPQDLTARQGIVWFRWRGWDYTLKKAMMMIKPKGPLANM